MIWNTQFDYISLTGKDKYVFGKEDPHSKLRHLRESEITFSQT